MVNSVSNSPYTPSSNTGNTAQDALKALMQLLQQQNSSSGNSAPATPTDPTQIAQNLFSQIDTTGKGTITKADLEATVTKAGGSKQAADALWTKLDPNNTGSVSAQQFAQNLPKMHGHHHHGGGKSSSSGAPATNITSDTADTSGGTAGTGSLLNTTA